MNQPIIRLELDRMKHTILTALSEMTVQIDKDVQVALEKALEPENIKRVIHETVQQTLNEELKKEIGDYFRWGNGKKALREAVIEHIDKRLGLDKELE